MKKFAIVGVILLLFTINASAVYWDLPRVFSGTQDVNGFAVGTADYLTVGGVIVPQEIVIDLKGTANTVQAGNLTATTADLQLSDGDRLALDYSETLTNLAGGSITIHMKRI